MVCRGIGKLTPQRRPSMPRAKTWAELPRRLRQRIRGMLLRAATRQDKWGTPEMAEAHRAAARELREPRREDDDG